MRIMALCYVVHGAFVGGYRGGSPLEAADALPVDVTSAFPLLGSNLSVAVSVSDNSMDVRAVISCLTSMWENVCASAAGGIESSGASVA